MMKRVLLVSIAVFLLSLVAGVFVWWKNITGPVSTNAATVDFLVVRGRSATQIGNALHEAGLIKSGLAFKFYVQITGKSDAIQAGEFRLSPSYSLERTVETLSGPPLELWVTVPEGLRREEVAERFIQGLEKSGSDVDIFREEFFTASEESEGYLFPDTYLFPRDAKAANVVTAMKNTFDQRLSELGGIGRSNLSLEEVVTLASIIERETKTDAERSVVAGILMNRHNIGMGLQADATVQYAIANVKCQNSNVKCKDWWVQPTLEDLKTDSPYNTYKYQGLPPGPIANAGLSSLEAAINPKETNYLYYIHDSEGRIHYAETLEAHNANVAKYLR